jgi:cyclic beta-1,2-glucan synthetase
LREESVALVAFQHHVESRTAEPIGEIIRREHHEETTDRVSIANAVGSLRQLARMEFKTIFESACAVEKILRTDPSEVYPQSDFSTRDRCRHAVEQIVRTGPLNEFEVARRSIKMAEAGTPGLENNVTHYLLGDGRGSWNRNAPATPWQPFAGCGSFDGTPRFSISRAFS